MIESIVLSEGTTRLDHIAAACLRWLDENAPSAGTALRVTLPAEALEALNSCPLVLDPESWWSSEAAADWYQDELEVTMIDVAPYGCWFGTHPDDPACVGYWTPSWDDLRKLAETALQFVTPGTAGEVKDEAPDWVHDLVSTVRGEFQYDDYAVKAAVSALRWIADAEDDDAAYDSARDAVSIYNADLVAWLGGPPLRVTYVDDTLRDLGGESIMSVLQVAQGMYNEAVVQHVIEFLREQAGEA